MRGPVHHDARTVKSSRAEDYLHSHAGARFMKGASRSMLHARTVHGDAGCTRRVPRRWRALTDARPVVPASCCTGYAAGAPWTTRHAQAVHGSLGCTMTPPNELRLHSATQHGRAPQCRHSAKTGAPAPIVCRLRHGPRIWAMKLGLPISKSSFKDRVFYGTTLE